MPKVNKTCTKQLLSNIVNKYNYFCRMKHLPLGKLFARLTKRYIELVGNELSDLDIERYYYCLHILATSNQPINQKELAEAMLVDKPAVVRIADYLEHHNCIARKCNPNDRREQFLILTPKGAEYSHRIAEAYSKLNQVFLSKLADIDGNTFIEELERMNDLPTAENQPEVVFNIKTKTNKNKV